jgi:hypothetical protein
MNQLEIIFIGLICLIGAGDTGRTVSVLDVSNGTEVHGHHVQRHSAFLQVPDEAYVDSSWDFTADSGNRFFPLDGYELSVENINPTDAFTLDPSVDCLVPHLTQECPEFGRLRSMTEIKAMSAAVLDITNGRLRACRREAHLPAYSIWTVAASGDEMRIVARKGEQKRWVTLNLKRGAHIRIVNNPTDTEMVENHFIAYYRLSATENACTNIPFIRKTPLCSQPACPDIVLTTAACSNSIYP